MLPAFDANTFYIFAILLVVCFLFIALCFFVFYLFTHSSVERVREQTEKVREDAFNSATNIVETARIDAVHLLEKANNTALEEAKLVATLDKSFDGKLKMELQEGIKELLQEVRDSILKENSKDLAYIRKSVEDIKQNMSKDVSLLNKELGVAISDTEAEIKRKIMQEYDIAHAETEKYKAERIASMDDKVVYALSKVAKDVLGVAIDEEQHKNLIIQSLERLRGEGVFDDKR